jgi:hypothetical protein
MDWVKAVGYRYEVIHTSVLEHLFTGESRATVAQELLGDGVPPIRDIEVWGREKRMPDRRRPIDLAATLRLPADAMRLLGVEVKVDSAWTGEQLRSTISDDDEGVLLAIGCTALAVTPSDLPGKNWRLVGPAVWATIVEAHRHGDDELGAYAKHVRAEAASHDRARAAVTAGRAVVERRGGTRLGHWAYF